MFNTDTIRYLHFISKWSKCHPIGNFERLEYDSHRNKKKNNENNKKHKNNNNNNM